MRLYSLASPLQRVVCGWQHNVAPRGSIILECVMTGHGIACRKESADSSRMCPPWHFSPRVACGCVGGATCDDAHLLNALGDLYVDLHKSLVSIAKI
jgi:hypothetical protein